jgi:hypothetical protein
MAGLTEHRFRASVIAFGPDEGALFLLWHER